MAPVAPSGYATETWLSMIRWHGHMLRMDEGNKAKQTTKMEVNGTRAKGSRRKEEKQEEYINVSTVIR